MFTPYRKDTQKQRAYDFYNSYKGEKVTWPTFYQRVRLGGDDTWEEKVKVKTKNHNHRNARPPKGRWAKEITWYNAQPEPKASRTLFRNRLNGGYPKEKAILMGEEWLQVKKERQIAHPIVSKPYTPKPKVVKPVDERDFKIEITLSKEEAKVFRKEYSRMIEDIEWALTYTEEKTEVVELNKKLTQLKAELMCFNCYNPR